MPPLLCHIALHQHCCEEARVVRCSGAKSIPRSDRSTSDSRLPRRFARDEFRSVVRHTSLRALVDRYAAAPGSTKDVARAARAGCRLSQREHHADALSSSRVCVAGVLNGFQHRRSRGGRPVPRKQRARHPVLNAVPDRNSPKRHRRVRGTPPLPVHVVAERRAVTGNEEWCEPFAVSRWAFTSGRVRVGRALPVAGIGNGSEETFRPWKNLVPAFVGLGAHRMCYALRVDGRPVLRSRGSARPRVILSCARINSRLASVKAMKLLKSRLPSGM